MASVIRGKGAVANAKGAAVAAVTREVVERPGGTTGAIKEEAGRIQRTIDSACRRIRLRLDNIVRSGTEPAHVVTINQINLSFLSRSHQQMRMQRTADHIGQYH